MSLASRFDHVPARTVRFWAMVDSGVIALALPFTAPLFLDLLYALNGAMGFEPQVPAIGALEMFFINLAGTLVAVWVLARLLHPVGVLAFVDGLGRLAVAALIVGYVTLTDAPPVLWFFVLTEVGGALPQLWACARRR